MLRVDVPGTPIGGEDAREQAWIEAIVNASSLANILLTFILDHGRRVDLDNLVRPAVRGLQKAGFYNRGYRNLDAITAIKTFGNGSRLVIEAGRPDPPTAPLFSVNSPKLAVGDRWHEWKLSWRLEISEQWDGSEVIQPVWVQIDVQSDRSLVDLMKPVIDGLEPILGRDPKGRLQFCPNDHLIEWLQIRRVQTGPALTLSLGLLSK